MRSTGGAGSGTTGTGGGAGHGEDGRLGGDDRKEEATRVIWKLGVRVWVLISSHPMARKSLEIVQ